jgi:hypothetical protein
LTFWQNNERYFLKLNLTYNDPAAHFVIDYARVSANVEKTMWPITRAVATRMMETGLYPVSQFLQQLPGDDLAFLMDCFDEYVTPDIDPARHEEIGTNLMCMALMLVQGEGLVVSTIAEADSMCRYLVTIVACERLKRDGKVKMIYENVTFGSDADDLPIVEKL